MRISLFGVVAVDLGEGPATVAASRPRTVLARLAATPGEVVSDDELAEAVWPGRQPASARTALQGYIGAVRDLLEPDRPAREPGTRVERVANGYVLRVAGDETDLGEFDRCVSSDVARAVALSSLPLLAADVERPWAEPIVARVVEARANAMEQWFGDQLHDANADVDLAALHDAVTEFPYRERLTAQLMLALYRRGRQHEALAAFGELRHRLLEELGVDPAPEVRELRQRVLEQDEGLLAGGVFEPASIARSRSASRRTMHAEQTASDLIGRSEDIDHVLGIVASDHMVTIAGPGGIGKTTVAEHVLHRIERRVADEGGERFVIAVVDVIDLESRADPAGLTDAICSELGVREHREMSFADVVGELADSSPVAIVIETCELAPAVVRDVIDELASAEIAQLTVIATSRVPLWYAGERLVRLAPLTAEESLALLGRTSSDVGSGDLDLWIQLVDRLDQIPLSLCLAAPRVAALGVDAVLGDVRKGRLADERPRSDTAERHQSIVDVARWSIDLLEHDEEREVLGQLCAFVRDVPLRALDLVIGDAVGDHRASDLLAGLVDASLVLRTPGEPARFHVLEAVRDALADDPTVTRGFERLTNATVDWSWSQTASTGSTGDDEWVIEQLSTVADRMIEAGDARRHSVVVAAASRWIERGELPKITRTLSASFDRDDVPAFIEAAARGMTAFALLYLGELDSSRRWVEQALAIEGWEDVVPGLRDTFLGTMFWLDQDFERAWASVVDSIDEIATVPRFAPTLLGLAGNYALWGGRVDEAAACYGRCREVARRTGDQLGEATGLRLGAVTAAHRGDDDTAWRWARRSVAIVDDLGADMWRAQSSATMAAVARIGGDDDEAVTWARTALGIARRQFDLFSATVALPVVAAHEADRGRLDLAARIVGWLDHFVEETRLPAHPASAPVLAEARMILDAGIAPTQHRRERAAGSSLSAAEILRLATTAR